MSKLLIVADIEDTCSALSRGLKLADEMDLVPEVVAFVYMDMKRLRVDRDIAAQIKKRLMDERKETLSARIEELTPGRRIKLQVVWAEEIQEWICKKAEGDYAAVVKSRHATESFGHTPTDWHLLRDCPAPVLLVGKKRWKKARTILATVDLDAKSAAKKKLNVDVVLEARHYAEIFEADLHILSVIDVPKILSELDLIDPKTYAKNRKEELQPALEALAKETGVPVSAFKMKRGPVASTIVSEASALKAQLVVMGTVGRKGVRAKTIGNTAEKALHHLKIDTLTLKP